MRVFENAGLAEEGITAKLRDRFAAVGLPVTDELLTCACAGQSQKR